jgi:hypothetical protein
MTRLHLVPRSKNAWSYTSTPQYAFIARCSVTKKRMHNFTFTLPLGMTHLHLVPESKNAGRYTSTPPIRLHGVVLSYKKAQAQLNLYLHIVPSWMRGAIPPLPNTPSWRGAQLQKGTGTNSPLPFTFTSRYEYSWRFLLTKRHTLSYNGTLLSDRKLNMSRADAKFLFCIVQKCFNKSCMFFDDIISQKSGSSPVSLRPQMFVRPSCWYYS